MMHRNPKDTNKILLEFINAIYKTNIQKYVVFIYISNELSDRLIKKIIQEFLLWYSSLRIQLQLLRPLQRHVFDTKCSVRLNDLVLLQIQLRL